MYSNIIWEKGTRKQGQIKNFYEARVGLDDKYKDIFTYEMYKEQVKDLMNEEWFKQTFYQENIDYQYKKVSYMIDEIE